MKKIVLILDSLDKIFPADGKIKGGANRVGKYLIENLGKLSNIELDIICSQSNTQIPICVNNVYRLNTCPFGDGDLFFQKAKEIIVNNKYDEIITSDIFAPFGNLIVHSHTMIFKNKNCKNFLEKLILSVQRRKKVQKFLELFKDKNRKIFTVSNKLSQDYIENIKFAKDNVVCIYPGVEQQELPEFKLQNTFTFGIVAGNAINKGGYLFVVAIFFLKLLKQTFQTKMIIGKSSKLNLMKFWIKLFCVQDKIEIIKEINGLETFYKSIDCLVLPSINEAFGLVLTEAASFGKPTLASSTAGSAEIISDNKNGFIFNRKNFLLFSLFNLIKKMYGILNISKSDFIKIQENTYELSKKFSWENYTDIIAKELNLL